MVLGFFSQIDLTHKIVLTQSSMGFEGLGESYSFLQARRSLKRCDRYYNGKKRTSQLFTFVKSFFKVQSSKYVFQTGYANKVQKIENESRF